MDLSTVTTTVTASVILALLMLLVIYVVKFANGVCRKTNAVLQWPGPERHWFWGTMHNMPIMNPKVRASGQLDVQLEYLIEETARYPYGYAQFVTFLRPGLIFSHPRPLKQILKRTDPKPTGAGSAGYNFFLPWLGDGLLLASGKKWFRNRRLLTPGFHFDILKPYIDVNNEEVNVLLDKMDSLVSEGKSFEVCKHISLCTLDILLRCICSQDSNLQMKGEDDQYVTAVRYLLVAILKRWLTPFYTFDFVYKISKDGRQFFQACDYVHDVADKVVAKRRQEIASSNDKSTGNNRKYLDFLDILLAARDDEGRGLTDLEIRNEVDTFLFEGHDTTAGGLTWALYCFAKYPEHQKKMQEEIDGIMEERDSDYVQCEDLAKMTYLTRCIKESLRMYPPVPFISRMNDEDVDIDGKTIAAGTQLDIMIYCLHHNPEVWEDHMEFKPDRFLPENIKKQDPFAFLPFSAGPRNCIGQTFAMNEMKVVLARILRRFHLSLDPTLEVHFAQEMLLKPHNDIKLTLCHRK